MNLFARTIAICSLASTTALPLQAIDKWKLDGAASSVTFGSVKNDTIAETHRFQSLVGTANLATGTATLEIHLATVDTGIEIRDKRMQAHLFNSTEHPVATASLTIPAAVKSLKTGESWNGLVETTVTIAGTTLPLDAELSATRLSDNRLLVIPAAQIMVNSEDWGLDTGIAKLQEIAGLDSIDLVAPVSFHLVWKQD